MQLYSIGEYRASKKWPYAICAGCVVFRKNAQNDIEVLLLSRDYDHDWYSAGDTNRESYHLPKGHVNFNETLEAAALRETEEEIGAKAEIVGYLGILRNTFDHPEHKTTTDKTIHYFAALWKQDTNKTDNEHDGRSWVPLEKAPTLLGSPNPKKEDEIVKRLKHFLELTDAS